MNRATTSLALALSLLLAATLGGLLFTRGATADGGSHRIVHLYVSGQGPQAKAWYSGGPPSGVPFQDALDTFAAQGFKYAAIASSGMPVESSSGLTATGDKRASADYVVLLER
jgi:hypothetical protein